MYACPSIFHWNGLSSDHYWIFNEDKEIVCYSKNSTDKQNKATLSKVFKVMRKTLNTSFENVTELTTHDQEQLNRLKHLVHRQFDNYHYKRNIFQKIRDTLTRVLIPSRSIEKSYEHLIDDLYLISEIDIEKRPNEEADIQRLLEELQARSAFGNPVIIDMSETNSEDLEQSQEESVEFNNEENNNVDELSDSVDTSEKESENLRLPEEESVSLDEEGSTYSNDQPLDGSEPSINIAKDNVDAVKGKKETSWKKILVEALNTNSQDKIILHITENPYSDITKTWSESIINDLLSDMQLHYHLFVTKLAQPSGPLTDEEKLAHTLRVSIGQMKAKHLIPKNKNVSDARLEKTFSKTSCVNSSQQSPSKKEMGDCLTQFLNKAKENNRKISLLIQKDQITKKTRRDLRLIAQQYENLQLEIY